MLKLEEIKKDAQIRGIQNGEIVRIVQVEPVGQAAVTVYYKDSQGGLGEQMLFRSDEARLALAQAGRPWAFDAPGYVEIASPVHTAPPTPDRFRLRIW